MQAIALVYNRVDADESMFSAVLTLSLATCDLLSGKLASFADALAGLCRSWLAPWSSEVPTMPLRSKPTRFIAAVRLRSLLCRFVTQPRHRPGPAQFPWPLRVL